MPLDPVLVENTRAWFWKAVQDIRAAEVDLAAQPPLLDDVMFHCQQAVEKSMKGLLVRHDCPFRKTHNLYELARQCAEIDPHLEQFLARGEYLSRYALEFRYPGEPSPSADQARKALGFAREILAAVLSRVPQEMHP
jgi:HEPN domain-containing protein